MNQRQARAWAKVLINELIDGTIRAGEVPGLGCGIDGMVKVERAMRAIGLGLLTESTLRTVQRSPEWQSYRDGYPVEAPAKGGG
jgi:hypothetical protein